ncbi:MAG: hypothetical protein JWP43_3490 [Ramlibacter sp.]|jgi:hypothetical protein|nr:hypothetical protein [Ramlibacter sp.]
MSNHSLLVNGKPTVADAEPEAPLLWVRADSALALSRPSRPRT